MCTVVGGILARGVTVDTFEGAFDTLEHFEFTQWSLAQYGAWVVDECEYLTPAQWRRLVALTASCPHVFILLAGDPCQFRPIGDDGGVTAAHFVCRNITLHRQMRFDANTDWGRICRSLRTSKPS